MTSICLTAENSAILRAANLLKNKLCISLEAQGIPLKAVRAENPSVSFDGKEGRIGYVSTVSFTRMLSLFVKKITKGEPFCLEESIVYNEVGLSMDLSRGGVMKPDSIMEYMEYMAMMGLDYILLYIEDIYTIPGLPYFGYMRGRYSEEELKQIDAHGVALGIEVIPMIQTASHLEQYLKWGENWKCRCSERTLLVGSEDTYTLIDQMISAVSRCFTTRRIHLGMDEAFDLNKGNYFEKNGLRDMADVFAEHVARVMQIAKKYDRIPMSWGVLKKDRASNVEKLKDLEGVRELITFTGSYSYIPETAFASSREPYEQLLLDMSQLWLCTPIWTWVGPLPDNKLTFGVCEQMFSYAAKYGFKNVVGTIWGDDGCECNHFFSLFGAQIYAEYKYNRQVTLEHVVDRFSLTAEVDGQAFIDMSDFHMVPDRAPYGPQYTNGHLYVHDIIGKKLLWQDIMVGLKDHQLYDVPMSEPYRILAEKFREYRKNAGRFEELLHFTENLFDMMSAKCAIAEQLKPRYESGDTAYLNLVAQKLLPELSIKVENTRKLHRDLWYATNKPFGYEVIDVRYGGLRARIDSAIFRITDYLEGHVDRLEELEELRLPMEVQDSLQYSNEISSSSRRWM